MHALSVRQPYAEQIASGSKRREFRTWSRNVLIGRDLLIVASKVVEPGGIGYPIGVAVCVVRVDRIVRGGDDAYVWHLADPRRVEPTPVKGSASLYHVDDARIAYLGSSPAVVPAAPRSSIRSRLGIPRASDHPYTFQDGDRKIRGEGAATLRRARTRARELADARGDYVYIMRDGLNVGGEWHKAMRESAADG